jgi:hypothetical protein
MSTRLSSIPISIIPSSAELGSGCLTQRNLEIAIRGLSRDGLVVLENMVDHATLDRLNVKMVADAYELQARKDSPFNYNKGNIQQDPPLTTEWFNEEIFTSTLNPQLYACHLKFYRPHRDPGHIHCSRSQTISAIHLREHCASSNARLTASISTHPQRRRLRASVNSICHGSQRSSGCHGTEQRLNRGLAWNPQWDYHRRSRGCARRPCQWKNQERSTCCSQGDLSTVSARCEKG